MQDHGGDGGEDDLWPSGSGGETMNGRVVLVTGAAGGVGRTLTKRLVNAGALVLAVDASTGAEAALREALGARDTLATYVGDLTTEEGAAGMVRAAQHRLGEPDTLIHLAGGFGMGPIEAPEAPATFEKMMGVNLATTFHAIRALVPGFRAKREGWVVAMGSKAIYAPPAQMASYVASKAALVALCQSLSEELKADGIHINVILPSTIDTPANRQAMGDANAYKWVTPDDIADAAMYLCSDRAKSLYGTTLELYGLS